MTPRFVIDSHTPILGHENGFLLHLNQSTDIRLEIYSIGKYYIYSCKNVCNQTHNFLVVPNNNYGYGIIRGIYNGQHIYVLVLRNLLVIFESGKSMLLDSKNRLLKVHLTVSNTALQFFNADRK